MMQSRSISTICFSVLLVTSTALAEPDAATKQKARDLGLKGLSAFDNGDYKAALEQLEQAYRMYQAPTLGLYSARALAKMGRLTAASARYLQVMRMTLPADASDQFRQAKADAETERAALIQRIPRLRVEIVGSGEPASVSIDGAPIAAKDFSSGISLNPGAHDVRVQQGANVLTMQVALQEGETKTITPDFAKAAGSSPVPTPAPAPPPTQSPALPATQPMPPTRPTPTPATAPPAGHSSAADSGSGSGSATLGWVLIGVGGVGLGVGAVGGLMASGKKSDLDGVCQPDIGHCPESSRSDVDGYNTLRTVSTIGFIAGGVGVVSGALVLVAAPKATRKERAARVTPWFGVASAGMSGRF